MKKDKETRQINDEVPEPQTAATPVAVEYSFAELVECHEAMGYPKEYVIAALRFGGVERATYDQAVATVKNFMRRVIQ